METILKWADDDGSFKRQESKFRGTISQEGSFKPEARRYVLYVSMACPWAHRALIVRVMKGLEDVIEVAVVHYLLDKEGIFFILGWYFDKSDSPYPLTTRDPVFNANYLSEIYKASDPEYKGRFTVPVLFDKLTKQIVNNESSDIIRIFNSSFNSICKNPELDLVPKGILAEIDTTNEWIYNEFNNGVYKAGFATSQNEYEKNATFVFNALEKINDKLGQSTFFHGDFVTETDIRIFTTAIR